MASSPAELPFATWAPSTSPLRIEYSKPVMEEVRARAVEGFYKLARGGVEVAGILTGEQQGDTIRILAQQPFEIEYAFGPTFLLSPRDHAFLRKMLDDLRAGPLPLGYKVLGVYISHSRGELRLTETDLTLFAELFPHSWQTVLVLKPSRAPETPAAFFVREPNGMVRANRSHLEFELEPGMGERRVRPAPRPRPEDPSLRALASAATRAEPSEPVPAIRQLANGRPGNEETRQVPPPLSPSAPGQAERPTPMSTGSEPPPTPSPAAAAVRPAARSQATLQQARTMAAISVGDAVPLMGSPPALRREPAISATPPQSSDTEGLVADAPMAWEDEQARSVRASSPLRLAIPAVALLLLAVLGYLIYLAFTSVPPKVVFYTKTLGDRVEVVWQLSGIRDATSAMITIENNGEKKTIDLIRSGQLSGSYADPLLTADSLVTLDVQRGSGARIRRVAPMIDGGSAVASLVESPATLPPGSAMDTTGTLDSSAGDPLRDGPAAPPPATETSERNMAGPLGITKPLTAPGAPRPSAVRELESSSDLARGAMARSGISGVTLEAVQPRVPSRTDSAIQLLAPLAGTAEASPLAGAAPIAELPQLTASAPASSSTPQPPPALPSRTVAPEPAVRAVAAPLNQPLAPTAMPTPAPSKPAVAAAKPAPPAARAGRAIWTGQLRKNQILQVNGSDANQGALNAALPGQPVRLSVLPGELTSQGLVVYTANPRYRDAANAVEEPGPTNGWNRTRYRYDPLRANSIIVTAIPNQTNRWQGITVRNDGKTVDVIVIDWLAESGN